LFARHPSVNHHASKKTGQWPEKRDKKTVQLLFSYAWNTMMLELKLGDLSGTIILVFW
jgi:hypothetical protein